MEKGLGKGRCELSCESPVGGGAPELGCRPFVGVGARAILEAAVGRAMDMAQVAYELKTQGPIDCELPDKGGCAEVMK